MVGWAVLEDCLQVWKDWEGLVHQAGEKEPTSLGIASSAASPTYATGAENHGKPLIIGQDCQKVSTTT